MTSEMHRLLPLCRVSFAIGALRPDVLDRALDACAASANLDNSTVIEALIQSVPYAGFPGVIEALGRWRARSMTERTSLNAPPDPPVTSRTAKGHEIFSLIYGHVSDRILDELRAHHPSLADWILDFAYGRVMARAQLPLRELEALGVSSLIGQRRAAPLRSHVRGALRTGWEPADLELLCDDLARECGAEHREVLQLVREMTASEP
ncbi:MAG: carboxymuconolactone decarboxylase family protein [Planctomycetota bacterium]